MRHHLHHVLSAIAASSPATVPRRNRAAVDQLRRAYREHVPLIVMTGQGREAARLVIDAFLDQVSDEHDVIRLAETSGDAFDCISGIVRAIDFDTEGLDLTDLRQILRMFLAYQHTHRRRTILCVEKAHEASGWALDLLEQLVKQELSDRCGLVVLLAGDTSLDDRLRQPALSTLAGQVGASIRIAPFDLDETRVYVQRSVEATEGRSVSEVFEFDAITRMHDVSAGVPDTINQLIDECLESAGEEPITPALVEQAAKAIEETAVSPAPDLELVAMPTGGQLVVRLKGEEVERRTIESEKLLIGRKNSCDMRLRGKSVSREHAVILWLDAGVRIVDLGSTNGTLVNGTPVDNCPLESSAIIVLGDFEIEFIPPE